MDWIDILIKVVPEFFGGMFHSWADIVLRVTPDFGVSGLPRMILFSSGLGVIGLPFLIKRRRSKRKTRSK